MALTGPYYLPGGKPLMSGGKFVTTAEMCCCIACSPACYLLCAGGCPYTCFAKVRMHYTRTITGSPPSNPCDIDCDQSVTMDIDNVHSTDEDVFFSGTNGGVTGTAHVTCVDGHASWAFTITGCHPPPPCNECGLSDGDTTTTSVTPFRDVNFCDGVVVQTVSYNADCDITITDTWVLEVFNNFVCP